MDLQKYDFKKLTAVDQILSTKKTIPDLLAEAKKRGYYNGNKKGNKLFATMFYKGGKPQFKNPKPTEQEQAIFLYMRSFAKSWEPKHQEKEAICAMLLDEIVDSID